MFDLQFLHTRGCRKLSYAFTHQSSMRIFVDIVFDHDDIMSLLFIFEILSPFFAQQCTKFINLQVFYCSHHCRFVSNYCLPNLAFLLADILDCPKLTSILGPQCSRNHKHFISKKQLWCDLCMKMS